jgi:hypothetical protein
MSPLSEMIAALATMSPSALRAEWRKVWRPPAPDLSRNLLARGIAWRRKVGRKMPFRAHYPSYQ